MGDVNDLHAINPRSEALILKRARMVYPVWVRANTALAGSFRTGPARTAYRLT